MVKNAKKMENKIKEVAERIVAVREDVGMTVEEMAEKTGVSVDEYRRLENGELDFNFTFIYKFSLVCGIGITDVMEGNSPILTKYTVTRKGCGLPFARREGYSYNNLAPLFKDKIAEPFYVEIPYSDDALYKPRHLVAHKGQEFDIVLKGCVKIQIGDSYEVLHKGDSIYYDSSIPHDLVAMGGETCQIYAVVMNPEGRGLEDYIEKKPEAVETNTDKAKLTDPIYERWVQTSLGENGVLNDIKFLNADSFNFAFDIVDELAKKSPNKLAMIHLSKDKEERRFTFKDMSDMSSQAANYYKSLGIKKDDKVMLVLRRNYQFWITILAMHKIGAVVIPATDLLKVHDFSYRFKAAGVSAIVCTSHGDTADCVDEAAKECTCLKTKVLAGGRREGWYDFDSNFEKFSKEFVKPVGEELRCGDDCMLMFFTSGTTGNPKMAMHSYKYALGHFVTAKYWHNVDPNGIHLTIADTGWGKALWGKLYGQWMCEAATFVYDFERFDANDILPLFAKYKITTFCAPPTMYRFFIKEELSKFDLSSVKYATVAGEALNPEVFNQFLKATGIGIMEGFGQTETTLTIANLLGSNIKPGSMGRPSPMYNIDIMMPDGNSAKAGEIGEIVVRTDGEKPCGLFLGYYNDEEKTNAVWHDGVYHTGDTAWFDQDGFYWFVGRVDDLIKSSGYRIGPFEIESVIMELPYVLECAVTAAPDEIRGQVVKASIVLTKETVGTDELKKEIQTYVKKNTAPYKYPRIVEFLDEMPKTISGKIRRVELKG